MSKEELFTTGKLAEQWGVSAKKIKDAIEKAGVTPDAKKGACSYFSKATSEKIRKFLDK